MSSPELKDTQVDLPKVEQADSPEAREKRAKEETKNLFLQMIRAKTNETGKKDDAANIALLKGADDDRLDSIVDLAVEREMEMKEWTSKMEAKYQQIKDTLTQLESQPKNDVAQKNSEQLTAEIAKMEAQIAQKDKLYLATEGIIQSVFAEQLRREKPPVVNDDADMAFAQQEAERRLLVEARKNIDEATARITAEEAPKTPRMNEMTAEQLGADITRVEKVLAGYHATGDTYNENQAKEYLARLQQQKAQKEITRPIQRVDVEDAGGALNKEQGLIMHEELLAKYKKALESGDSGDQLLARKLLEKNAKNLSGLGVDVSADVPSMRTTRPDMARTQEVLPPTTEMPSVKQAESNVNMMAANAPGMFETPAQAYARSVAEKNESAVTQEIRRVREPVIDAARMGVASNEGPSLDFINKPAPEAKPAKSMVDLMAEQNGPTLSVAEAYALAHPPGSVQEEPIAKPERMSLMDFALQPGRPESQPIAPEDALTKADIAEINAKNVIDLNAPTSEKMSKEDWKELDELMDKKPSRMKNLWKKFIDFAAKDGATDSDRVMGGSNVAIADRGSQADRYVIQPEMAKSEVKREDSFGFVDADVKKILALEGSGVNGQLEGSEIATLALKASDTLIEQSPELARQAHAEKSTEPDLTYNQIFKILNESTDNKLKLQMVQELNYRSRQNAGAGRDAGSKNRFQEAAPAAKPEQVVESNPDALKKAA